MSIDQVGGGGAGAALARTAHPRPAQPARGRACRARTRVPRTRRHPPPPAGQAPVLAPRDGGQGGEARLWHGPVGREPRSGPARGAEPAQAARRVLRVARGARDQRREAPRHPGGSPGRGRGGAGGGVLPAATPLRSGLGPLPRGRPPNADARPARPHACAAGRHPRARARPGQPRRPQLGPARLLAAGRSPRPARATRAFCSCAPASAACPV